MCFAGHISGRDQNAYVTRQPVLDILAEMIAHDKSIPIGKPSNDSAVDE